MVDIINQLVIEIGDNRIMSVLRYDYDKNYVWCEWDTSHYAAEAGITIYSTDKAKFPIKSLRKIIIGDILCH